jgi:hypothetical protein
MPKLRFIGDGHHTECAVFGMVFPAGAWVETPADHPATSLATNPMFAHEPDPERRRGRADSPRPAPAIEPDV